ncbi:MAG: hypothetical protein AM325_001905 [Candidatus Thorarchaeota archaeon SMTZ1-45]
MTDDETPKVTMMLPGVSHEEVTCPFSKGRLKRIGDALVFFMLFVTPILFLLALLTTR